MNSHQIRKDEQDRIIKILNDSGHYNAAQIVERVISMQDRVSGYENLETFRSTDGRT
jgi:hypothetical protein